MEAALQPRDPADDVLVAVEGPLLRVTINRPEKRNPLSRALLARIATVFRRHSAQESLALAVLSGAGDKSFAAGGDLRDLENVRTLAEARGLYDLGNGALDAIRRFPVPVVAALNGLAVGGGAELAVACDVRVAAAHARIGFVQGKLNIPTAWGGGADLAAIVGPARALVLLAGSPVLEARRALDAGLVDAVAAEGEDFGAFVARFIAPWLAQCPQVMRAFKWQVAAQKLGLPRAAAEERDRENFAQAWCHADHWVAAERILAKEGNR
jgi:enoyl-CoA hydratase